MFIPMDGEAPENTAVSAAEMRYAIGFSVAPEDLARLKKLCRCWPGSTPPNPPKPGPITTRPSAISAKWGWDCPSARTALRAIETLESLDAMGAGGFERPVWRVKLPRPAPDLAPLEDVDQLKDVSQDKLKPVFTCRLNRSRVALQQDETASIGLSFDSGFIRARDGRKLAVSEIEIELERGGPQACSTWRGP